MVRNILALQQNLLSVLSTAQCAPMERGREYYTLFGLGPEVGAFDFISALSHSRHLRSCFTICNRE